MSARHLLFLGALVASCAPAAPPQMPVRNAVTPQEWASTCAQDAGWDDPGPPFRIHGNAWYVGTCGISAILITGPDGHVVIDSGTQAGAQVVAANIRRLGFRLEDVKILLMSHEHHDHIGGMAALKGMTGAHLIASAAAAPVMASGLAATDDPQAGLSDGFTPAKVDRVLGADGKVTLGPITLHALATPGHTAGALTWQWQSCDGADCRSIVFADSLTAISNDTYRFTDHPAYITAFREGLARLAVADCDMLLTPHPSASDMNARAAAGFAPDKNGCTTYAAAKLAQLDARLAKEQTR